MPRDSESAEVAGLQAAVGVWRGSGKLQGGAWCSYLPPPPSPTPASSPPFLPAWLRPARLASDVSALAGAAGALYEHNLATLQASKFNYNTSILALVFVVLGGIGNIRGSIIAAVILTALPEMLRSLASYRMLIYSIILIVMMIVNWAPKVLEFRERHFGSLLRRNRKEAE